MPFITGFYPAHLKYCVLDGPKRDVRKRGDTWYLCSNSKLCVDYCNDWEYHSGSGAEQAASKQAAFDQA